MRKSTITTLVLSVLGVGLALLLVNNKTSQPMPTLTIAVAANFLAPLKAIAPQFEQQSGYRLKIISGSSGKLFAQIMQGAPIDIFLSADTQKPQQLLDRGRTQAVFNYARGQLVLVINTQKSSGFIQTIMASSQPLDAWLKAPGKKRIALANPSIAPYGQAAQQLLSAFALDKNSQMLMPHYVTLITAENVSQVAHFIEHNSVNAGFLAAALLPLLTPEPSLLAVNNGWSILAGRRVWWIPEERYHPIMQQGVILPSAYPQAAMAFRDYLLSDSVQQYLQKDWHYLPF